jgi:uncharacterized protein YdeI (BOF family)
MPAPRSLIRRPAFAAAAALLFGCAAGPKVLGRKPEGEPQQVAAARTLKKGAPVVLRGKMVEK